jgi:hypothetical protein
VEIEVVGLGSIVELIWGWDAEEKWPLCVFKTEAQMNSRYLLDLAGKKWVVWM